LCRSQLSKTKTCAGRRLATAFTRAHCGFFFYRSCAHRAPHSLPTRRSSDLDVFIEAGAACRRPTAGFYLYPDFGPVRDRLEDKGITTSDALADWLLAHHSMGVLPGSAFGDDDRRLRARVATSLLYGDTDQ